MRHWRERIPLGLTLSRGVLAPCVLACAYLWPRPALLVACMTLAFLTDVFDGVLARRWNVATAGLRRLDSLVDSLFYVCVLWAVWVLHPRVVSEHVALLVALGVLEGVRYGFDYLKFGREASYHLWSSKFWGLVLFVACVVIFIAAEPGPWPLLAIVAGIVADVEGLLVSMVLRRWQHDVPTLFHALRRRDAGCDMP